MLDDSQLVTTDEVIALSRTARQIKIWIRNDLQQLQSLAAVMMFLGGYGQIILTCNAHRIVDVEYILKDHDNKSEPISQYEFRR
jgi:hypothetical protein